MSEEAFRLGVMSAGVNRIDPSARDGERTDNRVLYGFEIGPAIIAAANAGEDE